VLGIILAANAAGSAVAIALLEPMIYSDGVGYKNAYFITAMAVACMLITVLLFYKDKPKEQQEVAPKKEETKRDEWEGFSYAWLKRKPIFYAIIICVALYALSSVSPIATPHLKDVGFSGKFIALNACVGSIVLMVSKILVGIIYDRFGIKIAVNLCLFTALTAKILLFFVTSQTPTLAILYTALISIATPFETVMIPIIVLDLFGQKSFDRTLTLTTSLFTVGHALNSPILNVPYDFSGSYMLSFVASTVVSVIIIFVLNYSMISLKKKQKQESLPRE
jgi:predicted MFS family arabinose efflux permease